VNVQQALLTAISSILITITLYHFFLSITIAYTHKRYLYYSISTFGGALFSFFALLMTYPFAPETVLWFHRLRIGGLMIGTLAWFYCIYEIYFNESRIPQIYLWICLITILTVPTPVFLSLPIHQLKMTMAGIPFTYHYATMKPAYSLYAVFMLAFFCYSFLRVVFYQNPVISKRYGILAFLPGIIAGLNDYAVIHGLIRNILISEYLVFMYLLSVFTLFLRQEKMAYQLLQKLNQKLEAEVCARTEELTLTNNQLHTKIAESIKSETEIQRAKEFLDNIIETSQDCIIMADTGGFITKVNTAFLELVGYGRDEVQGKHMSIFVPQEPGIFTATTGESVQLDEPFFQKRKGMIETLRTTGKLENWTTYYWRQDHAIIPMEANVIVLYHENGQPMASVGMLRDITERKKAEQEALIAQKMAAVGQLAGGISHDFNNLLCIIIGNVSLAKDNMEHNAYALRKLDHAEKALFEANLLTQKFITFATDGESVKEATKTPA